ncbi:MAG: DoxX family membrane protein [Caldilineaceae bacterium]|nr:DoxX family membrane protein [Caldilineaceae bacterium]MDE0465186.1 DoxX family membrane protein [Caldilineaceae bacterium]MXX23959.1 DoxX family membrane protein [Caldilineaceae bacterium SB0668_bin_21]MYC20447.1 DoxX family membrane protein [Caldilineaceae bacterium SB0662_bin_25]
MGQEQNTARQATAILRITLGVILIVTWFKNLQDGIYTADGIVGLFNYLFNDNGGGPAFYRAIINGTILQVPGLFAVFQLVGELLMGLGLLVGLLTPLAAIGAALFFFNLFLAYLGGSEWIWTYVLLTVSALVVALAQSGRAWGLDSLLLQRLGEPPRGPIW